MRLRLSIHRHGLPPVKTLWALSTDPANPSNTVSQLLQQVNEVFPLESEDWGLEDYAVELDGFECLHYSSVEEVFKDNDLVTIRPLQTPEIRARTVSGRYQISAAGQHLIDGIPFGKNGLRRPSRPPIHIPPRKRRRLTVDEEEETEEDEPRLLIKGSTDETLGGAEDDEDDEEYNPELDEEDQAGDDSDEDDKPTSSEPSARSSKRVKFKTQPEKRNQGAHLIALPSDDNDSEEEYASETEFSSGTSEASDSSDSDESEESENLSEDSDNSDSESSEASSSEASSEDIFTGKAWSQINSARSKKANSSQSNKVSQYSQSSQPVPPGYGKSATRARNVRRRDHKKLCFLKSRGILPANASKKDLDAWQAKAEASKQRDVHTLEESDSSSSATDSSSSSSEDSDSDSDSAPEQQPIRKNKTTTTDSKKDSSKQDVPAIDPKLEAERQRLLARLAADGGIDVSEPPPKRAKLRGSTDADAENGRRSHNVNAARRMILGGLGIRDPNKPKAPTKPPHTANAQEKLKSDSATTSSKDPQLSEAAVLELIKSKFNIRAVECVVEDIKLSAPPYPFQQGWDPQFHSLRAVNTTGKRGKKRGRNSSFYQESTWDENGYEEQADYGGEVSILDYDDPPKDFGNAQEDGYPPLPSDISSLPALTEATYKPGAFVVFKQMLCEKATNWSPTLSDYRTARVEEQQEDGSYSLTLAPRDRPKTSVKYDQNGRRIYEKFEQINVDDEEDDGEDESTLYLHLSEMIDPRLLKAASEGANGTEGMSNENSEGVYDSISKAFELGYEEGKAANEPKA